MTSEEFINECKKISIFLSNEQIKKIEKYKDLLIEWNNKFNLTTITDEKSIYLKHFFDSLYLTNFYDINNKSLCDFGTGAGFPGMILAIVFKNTKIDLLESNNKKVSFLNEVKKQLNLENIQIINERAEIYGKNNRELYDIVTCRAVANLSIILELAAPMIKVNGVFLPMKSNVQEELRMAEKTISILSLNLEKIFEYNLPIEKSKRTILLFRKTKETNLKYPRNYNIIKKSVLH